MKVGDGGIYQVIFEDDIGPLVFVIFTKSFVFMKILVIMFCVYCI
jgi:hypothetical protein